MWMRMGFKLMVLLLNSQLHRTFIDSKFTSPTEIIHEFSIKKKTTSPNPATCSPKRGTFHQLTTSSTTSLSSMSMASSSSGPKRFSSRIQVTDSSRRARVSSIRTTSSPADVNQQLVLHLEIYCQGGKKNTKLAFLCFFFSCLHLLEKLCTPHIPTIQRYPT